MLGHTFIERVPSSPPLLLSFGPSVLCPIVSSSECVSLYFLSNAEPNPFARASEKAASVPREYLSHTAMQERVEDLDMKENRSAFAGALGGPRRPLEDPDGGMDEVRPKWASTVLVNGIDWTGNGMRGM